MSCWRMGLDKRRLLWGNRTPSESYWVSSLSSPLISYESGLLECLYCEVVR